MRFATLRVQLLLALLALPCLSHSLTRDEIIATANGYVNHTWTATSASVCHGVQSDGRRVDTPNQGYSPGGAAGWWSTTATNASVPYKWGGNETVAGFVAGLARNPPLCAGDRDTDSKVVGSAGAAGVDCSGLVSRAWGLTAKQSTSTIPSITRELKDAQDRPDYRQLRRGDVLNIAGSHVMLVAADVDESSTEVSVIEASARDWRVSRRTYQLSALASSGYVPLSYFAPADIAVVIDRSGSMSGLNIIAAKEASKLMVDMMKVGDKIGVVSFASTAVVNYPLTEIDSARTVATAAKISINALVASGGTGIGAGLQAGQQQLTTRGLADASRGIRDPAWAMILLSDGFENVSPLVRNVLPAIVGTQTRVYTIGLGANADGVLLNSIAAQTRGLYRYAPNAQRLGDIYDEIESLVSGRARISSTSSSVQQGQIVTSPVQIDSSVSSARFVVTWPGSDLDLALIDPSGRRIDRTMPATDPNIRFSSGGTYEIFEIQGPAPGRWVMEVTGVVTSAGGSPFTATVSGVSTVIAKLTMDKLEYLQGQPIKVLVSLEHPLIDNPVIPTVNDSQFLPRRQPILGAVLSGTVNAPNGDTFSISLRDDGTLGDAVAGDGNYTTTFNGANSLGAYPISVNAAGNTNLGSQFARNVQGTAVVSAVITVNTPPTANAGPNQTLECSAPAGAAATLNGTGSFDPDGDALSYLWTGGFGAATGPTPSFTLPLGSNAITLQVNDLRGGTATASTLVRVVDTTPPTFTNFVASKSSLWPPNHKMTRVNFATAASDRCDVRPVCRVTSVTSNEPENGTGDGDTSPDWQIVGDLAADLRAERAGTGAGRRYTITAQCTDASGNSSTRSTFVDVARSQSGQ